MPIQDEYKVQLEVFEGPLDLLLYLIKKEELNIYNIPIETVTAQYVEYLNLMRMLDLNIAGEFLVMAATLMMIKSRMLLPVEERPEMEEEEEDPRWDLVRQLVEYKKFKDAALRLQEKEFYQENVFNLGGEGALAARDDAGVTLQDISLFDLIAAFNEVLKKARPEEIGQIYTDRFTVADQIDMILGIIRKERKVRFRQLFGETASRPEIICTFLALLELIRLRQLTASQKDRFGEIYIELTEEPPYVPAGVLAEAEPADAGDAGGAPQSDAAPAV